MGGDLSESRKAACVLSQLDGAPAEYGRDILPDVLANGGLVNGVMADPMMYLMHSLAGNYSVLGEEQRLQGMTDIMSYARRPGERTDELLTIFDAIRMRAPQTGQLQMSISGLKWLVSKAIWCNGSQLICLLQPHAGTTTEGPAGISVLLLSLIHI